MRVVLVFSCGREVLCSRTVQLKEGLNKLCCLLPYNFVTFEVWDYIIPFWLEAIRTEITRDELQELKIILRLTFF